jgi:hypothetical protein
MIIKMQKLTMLKLTIFNGEFFQTAKAIKDNQSITILDLYIKHKCELSIDILSKKEYIDTLIILLIEENYYLLAKNGNYGLLSIQECGVYNSYFPSLKARILDCNLSCLAINSIINENPYIHEIKSKSGSVINKKRKEKYEKHLLLWKSYTICISFTRSNIDNYFCSSIIDIFNIIFPYLN